MTQPPLDVPWPEGFDPTTILDARLGIELLELTADRARARVPVAGNTQPAGYWHGGASCVVAESLGSLMAWMAAGPDSVVFGVDINATHHRAVRAGHVHAEAAPLFVGRSTATYDIVLSDDAGQRVCTARLTVAIRRPRPDAAG